MKTGQKIKVYFRCAGTTSTEKRIVYDFDEKTITTDTTLHPDSGGEEYERFSRKTGECLNDNTMLAAKRWIDPQ